MIAFLGSSWQWVIVLVVVLLLFGNRLPGVARSLGAGITEFKKGLKDGNDKEGGNNPPKGNPDTTNRL